MAAGAVPPLVARVAVAGGAVAGSTVAGGAVTGVVTELTLVVAPWWPVAATAEPSATEAGVTLLALQTGG